MDVHIGTSLYINEKCEKLRAVMLRFPFVFLPSLFLFPLEKGRMKLRSHHYYYYYDYDSIG